MYGIPQLSENVEFLRASGEQLRQMRRVVAPLARTLATRLAARRRRSRAGSIDLRKTLRKSMSHRRRADRRGTDESPRPARPELVVLCDVSGSVAGFSHFTLLLVHALRQQFSRVRVFAFIDTTDEVTHMFGPEADLAVAIQRITREAGVSTAATDIPTTATRSRPSCKRSRMCCRRAARCWCSATGAPTTATRRPTCWPTW